MEMGRRRSEAEGSNTTSIEVKQHNCFTSRDVVIDPVKVVQVDQSWAKEMAGPSKVGRPPTVAVQAYRNRTSTFS